MKKAIIVVLTAVFVFVGVVSSAVTPVFANRSSEVSFNLDKAVEVRDKMDKLAEKLEGVLVFCKGVRTTNFPDHIKEVLIKAQTLKNELDDLELVTSSEVPELVTHKFVISKDDALEIYYEVLKSNILLMQCIVMNLDMIIDYYHNAPPEEFESLMTQAREVDRQKRMIDNIPVVYLAK